MASEYLAMMENLISAKRAEAQAKNQWNGDVPVTEGAPRRSVRVMH